MRGDTLATGLLAVGSSLPAVGVVAFGWGPIEAVSVYTAEVLTLVCSYAVVALFAQQPSAIDERERVELPLLPVPDLEAVPESLGLPGLPAIRTENVHVVAVFVVFLSTVLLTAGAALTGNLADDPTRPVLDQVDPLGYLSAVIGAFSPSVTAVAGVVSVIQAVVVYRWYVAPARHRSVSAYVVVQRANRTVFGYGTAVVVWCVVGSLVATVVPVDTTLSVVGAVCLSKCLLEAGRVRGEAETADSDTGTWLVPADAV